MLDKRPFGMRLTKSAHLHRSEITSLSWADDKELGRFLISTSTDCSCRIWRDLSSTPVQSFVGHTQVVDCAAWDAGRRMLFTGSWDHTVKAWSVATGEILQVFSGHRGSVWQIAPLFGSGQIASASSDATIRIWDLENAKEISSLNEHVGAVYCLTSVVRPGKKLLISGSSDGTVRVWDLLKRDLSAEIVFSGKSPVHSLVSSSDGARFFWGTEEGIIRGYDLTLSKQIFEVSAHLSTVKSLSINAAGSLIASKSTDSCVKIWSVEKKEGALTLTRRAVLSEPFAALLPAGLALDGEGIHLATLGDTPGYVNIWRLKPEILCSTSQRRVVRTATVVILGDSGAGKSGLVNALSSLAFRATESTHLRNVERIELEDDNPTEIKQLLLWDLAGQPAYRVVHRIYAPKPAVAILAFDPRTDLAPDHNARYWSSLIRTMERDRLAEGSASNFLVLTRADLLNIRPSTSGLKQLQRELQFDRAFIVSAKTGEGIKELYTAIISEIDWSAQRQIELDERLDLIVETLRHFKHSGLLTVDFHTLSKNLSSTISGRRITARSLTLLLEELQRLGIIHLLGADRQLASVINAPTSRSTIILLQPDLIEHAAAAIVGLALSHNGSLSKSLLEQEPRSFRTLFSESVASILLSTALTDMIEHGVAVGHGIDPELILFPELAQEQQVHRLKQRVVTIVFSGSPILIFSTAVSRLARSVQLKLLAVYHHYAHFSSSLGLEYELALISHSAERGDIELYVSSKERDSQLQKEIDAITQLIKSDIEEFSTPGSVRVLYPTQCSNIKCGWETPSEVQRCLSRAHIEHLKCPLCGFDVAVRSG